MKKSARLSATSKQFDQYTNSIFVSQISQDTLSLHFYLADESKYIDTTLPQSLGSYSMTQMRNSQQYYIQQINMLKSFDYNDLTTSQQQTYDILLYYFQNELDFSDICECYECLSPTIGFQSQFPIFLSEYDFYDYQDIDNYFSLLECVPEFFNEIITFEQEKCNSNTFMIKHNCDLIVKECLNFSNDLSDIFSTKLKSCKFINKDDIPLLQQKYDSYMNKYVIPSYRKLGTSLDSICSSYYGNNYSFNPNKKYGLSTYSNGKAFYEYLIKTKVGSSKTVLELKGIIQQKSATDMAVLSAYLNSHPNFETTLQSDFTTTQSPNEIIKSVISRVASSDININPFFCTLEPCYNISYSLKNVDPNLEDYLSPAFYLSPPIDKKSDNTIYINNSKQFAAQNIYPTLVHEGIPGHMYQNFIFQKTNPSIVRNILNYGGYTEGWATYVESLCYNFSKEIPDYTDAYAASNSFNLAIYSLVDIGVNYEGWSLNKTKDFLQNYGITDDKVFSEIYYAVMEAPANYLQYYCGYLEILLLKQRYLETHKQKTALSDFHKFILEFGPAPFEVINKWMK